MEESSCIIDDGTYPARRAVQILTYYRLRTLLGSVVQQVSRAAQPGNDSQVGRKKKLLK